MEDAVSELLRGLKAAAEPTRLRILSLCAHAELTVSDLVEILGQSQPRVSRHLRLLVEAGLLQRNQEGAWAWYRLPSSGTGSELVHTLVDLIPQDDRRHAADLQRLQSISQGWARRVEEFFQRHAEDWEEIRSLHADQESVDKAVIAALGAGRLDNLLDIGTGAGHMLLLLGDRAERGVGIDRSTEMLAVARHNLFQAELRHCEVRQADMTALPFDTGSFDAATLSMVLHFAEDPGAVIAEAARVLRPGGKAVVVDFAEHEMTSLREEQAHRWLGFDNNTVEKWARGAGLETSARRLKGGELTVVVWTLTRPENARRSAKRG
jgi:ArsR family transcriptional regulator